MHQRYPNPKQVVVVGFRLRIFAITVEAD